MDNNKFAFVVMKSSEESIKLCLEAIEKIDVPENMYCDVIVVENASSKGVAYNEGMRQSDAKYKIYIDDSVVALDKYILHDFRRFFLIHANVGLVGLVGSAILSDGGYKACKKIYGKYLYKNALNKIEQHLYIHPLFAQKVSCIDSMFMVTCEDHLWDEAVGDLFLGAAHACKFKSTGRDVCVIMQNDNKAIFSKLGTYQDSLSDEYNKQRSVFYRLYKEQFLPLVTIGIPTYNAPFYFEKALCSALQQDYGNIEIIIGDDSTNNDTELLMKAYIERYKNICYFHHEHPLGENGYKNFEFIVSKAKGEYINLLLHDDIIYSNKISKMVDVFLEDYYSDIALVTSSRYIIDIDDNIKGIVSPYIPKDVMLLSGNDVSKKMIMEMNNFIGEFSTVLMKRRDLFDEKRKRCIIFRFMNIRDFICGDIATWLNLCKFGKKCVYLPDVLSAFRIGASGQKSMDPTIWIRCALDWIGYIAIAWQHRMYITEEKDLCMALDNWLKMVTNNVLKHKNFSPEKDENSTLIMALMRMISARQYNNALKMSAKHLMSYSESNRKVIMNEWKEMQ